MVVVVPESAANEGVWPGWSEPITRLPYVALDLETTGLDPVADRVIEVAALASDGSQFTSLVNPGPGVEITGPHGLTAAQLDGAPEFDLLAWRLRKLLAGRIVVAHNARFDLAFLGAEFARLGRPLPPAPFVCTMGLAQVLALGHESRSLTYACHRHGISQHSPHTATGDALAAAALFESYAAQAEALGLDLHALARLDGEAAGAESWRLGPLEPPRRGEFRPSLTGLARSGE